MGLKGIISNIHHLRVFFNLCAATQLPETAADSHIKAKLHHAAPPGPSHNVQIVQEKVTGFKLASWRTDQGHQSTRGLLGTNELLCNKKIH